MKKPKPRRKPVRTTPAAMSRDQRIDLLLSLWEDGETSLADIAKALKLSMRSFMKLIREPEVSELLEQITAILELRMKHLAQRAAPRAIATLETIQTEAEAAARQTPISAQALKAHRDAKADRTQRRLAATAILSHLRTLKAPAPKVAPLADRREARKVPAQPARTPTAPPQPVAA